MRLGVIMWALFLALLVFGWKLLLFLLAMAFVLGILGALAESERNKKANRMGERTE